MRRWIAIGFLLLAASAGAVPDNAVPSDPADVVPLAVGSAMPTVTVQKPDGTDRRIGPGPLDRPTILIFYRGGWCPYCNRHLGVLKKVEPQLLALGYDLLFLSADRPDILYSSLKEPDIHYTLLSDASMSAARAYHIAYHLDAEALAKYGEYGVDLEAASGHAHHQLPVPAVFIVDKAGVVRFVYANPDYTTRITLRHCLTPHNVLLIPASGFTYLPHSIGRSALEPYETWPWRPWLIIAPQTER